MPFFSVITSTFGRGRHIAPTIESALSQSFEDFELIVVGDGCDDETKAAVLGFGSERLRFVALPFNTGSQSVPNNVGIGLARGHYVAYLGHDDIWARDHLEALHAQAASAETDFVVSGCVYYGPPGSDVYIVTGLFEDTGAAFQHFFPPTSLAHRRDVTQRIGAWSNPMVVRAPVDCEFLLRAAQAGLRFRSTGRITAHKFAAGHRYLSYLRIGSDEQRDRLRRLAEPGAIDLGQIVETSRRHGHYMTAGYQDYSQFAPGQMYESNRRNKGLSRPALRPLHGREVIEQGVDERALDWHCAEPAGGDGRLVRWSGPNPKPKLLIPFSAPKARVSIEIPFSRPDGRLAALWLEDEPLKTEIRIAPDGGNWLSADVPLSSDDYTVLTLDMPTFCPAELGLSDDDRRLGVAVGRVVVEACA